MAICCWRCPEDFDDHNINLAIKGEKRTRELASALREMRLHSPIVKYLDPPPFPIQHIDGGPPLHCQDSPVYHSLKIQLSEALSPELAIEIKGDTVLIAVPEILVPELAAMIEESNQIQSADEPWIHAIISDEAIQQGTLRVWTWNEDGLITAG